MHPALSVIAFTTLSGAGYGLLVWLAVAALLDAPLGRGTALAAGALALGLVTAGLLSSLAHLGHPERAWRALSQWRSSWLSREGVAALVAYGPALYVVAALAAFVAPAGLAVGAALAIAAAFATLYCTARIYGSLKTVRAWHNGWTLPGYLLQALWTGTALAWLVGAAAGVAPRGVLLAAFAALTALTSAHTLGYRRWRAALRDSSTLDSATGLGRFGAIRSFERPHTETNYLLREMGFVLARKHARRLATFVQTGFGAAFAALALALLAPGVEIACAAAAAVVALLTTFVERWTFFAQARHVVTLYYGVEPARP